MMGPLTELPSDITLVATRGNSSLYIYNDQDPENIRALGVLVNPTTNTIAEVPVHSALARGYWDVIETPRKKKEFDPGQRK